MSLRDGPVIVVSLILAPLAKVVESVAAPATGGPDLLLVLAVCVGWLCDPWHATPAGFALGLVEDLVVARCLGSRAIPLAIAALLAGSLKSILSQESLSSKTLAALAGSTVADYATWGILAAKGIRIVPLYFVRSIWMPSALWAAFLVGPMHFALMRLAAWAGSVLPPLSGKGREAVL